MTTSSTERRKILAFDSWTGGVRHYTRLLSALDARGYDLSLVHLGSWGSDPGRPATEIIDGLDVRDIASYPSASFLTLLDRERPDAVLFLSTDTFAHRAFNRYCRLLGIPTVHLYHGLVRVQAVDGESPYRVNPLAQLRWVAARLIKALRHVWPAYLGSMVATDAPASAVGRFVEDIVRQAIGRVPQHSAEDARTTRCCVYVGADAEHAVRKYGFAPRDVSVVGNPDLIQFGLNADLMGVALGPDISARSYVTYADTGLVHTGWVFASERAFFEHLIATRDAVGALGKELVFKPHPDHWRTDLPKRLRSEGIIVARNEDFVTLLQQSTACIVEPSTVAIIPALLGLPVLLANFGPLADMRYGGVIKSYPRARALTDLAAIRAVVEEIVAAPDDEGTRAWLRENAGPLPAEQMPDRVAAVFDDVCSRTLGSRASDACARSARSAAAPFAAA